MIQTHLLHGESHHNNIITNFDVKQRMMQSLKDKGSSLGTTQLSWEKQLNSHVVGQI